MKVPESLALTIEDVRYVKNIQLQNLTGIDASNFSAWSSHRQISERNLERIAARLGMTKGEFIEALDLRRRDTARAKIAEIKADRLTQFLLEQEVSA